MDDRLLNVVSEDATGCCAGLRKALREKPDLPQWTCKRCGMDWKPRETNGMRLWEAHPMIVLWK